MKLRDHLRQDAVGALRVLDPDVVGPEATVADAIALMQEKGSGCVIVTEHGCPIGIFTERDVLTRVVAKGLSVDTPIVDVMTSSPRVLEAGCSVADLIERMHEGGLRHMPVVDGRQRLCGVVSVKRIVEYLVDYFPSAVFNLPPEPGQKMTAREGA